MRVQQLRASVAVVTVTLGFLVAFAGDGLKGYFGPDEMMNLYQAWFPPIGQLLHHDRPIGVLAYRLLFAAFGLNPLPYRIFCFLLLAVNLYLLYRFCKSLSASREAAVIALLLGAYHAHLADFYYTSSAIFDLLCYLFYYLALTRYIELRRNGIELRWSQVAPILSLYLCALGSKEMAVTFPVMVIVFDLLYDEAAEPVRLHWKNALRGWRLLAIAIPLDVLYCLRKTLGAGRMTVNPDYQVHLSLHAWMAAWQHYLGDLFYGLIRFNDVRIVALWLFLLALALLARRREMLFAWFLMLLGAMPVLFITPRGFYAVYLTLPGWYLYGGSLIVICRDALRRSLPALASALAVRPEQLALYGVLALAAIPLHLWRKPVGDEWVPAATAQTRPVIEQLRSRYPQMRRGSKLLFLSDPCPPHDSILYFLVALLYRDQDVHVDRAKDNPALLTDSVRASYDHVFDWGPDGLREVGRNN